MGTNLGFFLGGAAEQRNKDRQFGIQEGQANAQLFDQTVDSINDVVKSTAEAIQNLDVPGDSESAQRIRSEVLGQLARTTQFGAQRFPERANELTSIFRAAETALNSVPTAADAAGRKAQQAGQERAATEAAETAELERRIKAGLVSGPKPRAPSANDIIVPILSKIAAGQQPTPAEREALDLALRANPIDRLISAAMGGQGSSASPSVVESATETARNPTTGQVIYRVDGNWVDEQGNPVQ